LYKSSIALLSICNLVFNLVLNWEYKIQSILSNFCFKNSIYLDFDLKLSLYSIDIIRVSVSNGASIIVVFADPSIKLWTVFIFIKRFIIIIKALSCSVSYYWTHWPKSFVAALAASFWFVRFIFAIVLWCSRSGKIAGFSIDNVFVSLSAWTAPASILLF